MGRYVARRALQSVAVLFGVSVVVFALMHLVPGDPVRVSLGTRFTQEAYDALRARAGLDLPLVTQYLRWVGSAITGDLGVSFRSGDPVTGIIIGRLPATMGLAVASLVVGLVIAWPLGVLSALKRGSATEAGATVFSQIGISIPDFFMAIVFILLFAETLGWLPSGGYVPLSDDPVGWLQRVTMPAITIGVVTGAILTRFVRSATLEVLGEDFVRTARAKGLSRSVVLRRHVLRNALIPVVTVTGLQLAFLLGGVVVVEIIFSWPGLGQLAIQAVNSRDYPLLQGTVLVLAVVFLLINLLVDLIYAKIDPRISYR